MTATVKVEVPEFVGVPAIVPEGDKVRPRGNAPDFREKVYGCVPPLA